MITRIAALALALCLAGCANNRFTDDDPAEQSDDAASVNFKLGIGYMQAGRYSLAQLKLQRALEYNPDLAEAHNALGVLFEQLNNVTEAEAHYQLAVKKQQDYALAQMNYGRLLCATGKAELGEQQFLAVTRSSTYRAQEIPFTGAGVCARARNDLSAAEQYFRQGLKVNPLAAGTLLEIASLSVEQKKFADARQFLQRYHRQAGYNPVSLNLAIRIEDALGDKQASAEFRRLLQAQSKT